jgi:hypothetical protein
MNKQMHQLFEEAPRKLILFQNLLQCQVDQST